MNQEPTQRKSGAGTLAASDEQTDERTQRERQHVPIGLIRKNDGMMASCHDAIIPAAQVISRARGSVPGVLLFGF